MSDVRLTIDGIKYTASVVAQAEPVVDAIAALQLILLALIEELQDGGAIDPQMLAARLKGIFPEDAADSTVKGLVEVFGRRLEPAEEPTREAPRWPANGEGERAENARADAPPTMFFQAYRLADWVK